MCAMVYSTETGRLCPECGEAKDACVCKSKQSAPEGDGIVRVRREKKGRGGKTVTIISGLEGDKKALAALNKTLKRRFGCGGAVKDWAIELQGDLLDQAIKFLQEQGHKVKQNGG